MTTGIIYQQFKYINFPTEEYGASGHFNITKMLKSEYLPKSLRGWNDICKNI